MARLFIAYLHIYCVEHGNGSSWGEARPFLPALPGSWGRTALLHDRVECSVQNLRPVTLRLRDTTQDTPVLSDMTHTIDGCIVAPNYSLINIIGVSGLHSNRI